MPVTLDTNTLLPLGFVITILGAVWYMSKKINGSDSRLASLEAQALETKNRAQDILRRADFDKHEATDAIFQSSIKAEVTEIKLAQARMDTNLTNISSSLVVMHADVKKILEK